MQANAGEILSIKLIASDGNLSSTQTFNLAIAKSIISGSGNDSITGTASNDIIQTAQGNDIINAGSGNDYIDGGIGSDLLNGGDGDDIISYSNDENWGDEELVVTNLGSPKELIYNGQEVIMKPRGKSLDGFEGGNGYDIINMSNQAEILCLDDPYSANPFNSYSARIRNIEEINAGGGNDVIDLTSDYFSYGNIIINGDDGNDVLWSSEGNDIINGGAGNDNIDGNYGDDNLNGNEGDDIIYGRSGNDIINGGAGRDQLFGNAGNDIFRFDNINQSTTNNPDYIADFTKYNDKIDLQNLNYETITFDNNPTDNITPSGLVYYFSNNETIITDQEHNFTIKLSSTIKLDDNDFVF